MGLQKYRADVASPPDAWGQVEWVARWMGGPTLALVRNCVTPWGRRTVYVTGEPDTWFSVPAACSYKKRRMTGYLTTKEIETPDGPVRVAEFRAHTTTLEACPSLGYGSGDPQEGER